MNKNPPSVETERIWRELSDRLRRFVASRVSSMSDVDDILQNVFLNIHQKLDSLRSHERLESWVFQITRNAVVDHFRKSRGHEPETEIAVESDTDRDANAEVSQCIKALISQLPEKRRRAVSLYELHGIPQAAIAEQESISLSAAKSRVQRGRAELASMLRACCRFELDARGNVLDYQRKDNASCESDCDCADAE